MKVSIKKISEITGFSSATVSNALNNKRGVNAETAAKIFDVAQQLGYFEENQITKVKFLMFKRTGVVVEDTPFFPLMIAGAEQECRLRGLELQICNLGLDSRNYNEELRRIQNEKNSAVIILGTELMDKDIALIQNMLCPFVVIDYWKEDAEFDSILINNSDSAWNITKYLIRKGHSKIGYLCGNMRIKPFRSREAGYLMAMQDSGFDVNPAYRITLSTTLDGAYANMRAYLESRPNLPTAFIADNDMIALGAMKAMAEAGLRVPEDISVVGFDDLTFSSISSPPLTTMRVPKQEMGSAAVRRLCDIIERKETVHFKTQICTQFIERDSVKTLS